MNALVHTLLGTHHPSLGQRVENTAALDLSILATLGFLFFLLGCFATWAWLIWRRGSHLEPHVKLLMELEEEERDRDIRRGIKPGQNRGQSRDCGQKQPSKNNDAERSKEAKQPPPAPPADTSDDATPWERPGDWWKQE